MFDWGKILADSKDFIGLGLLGAFGGLANYVHVSIREQKPFTWKMFLANLFLAVFVGIMLGQFVTPDNPFRDGMIMAFGFCAYPLLNIVESQVVNVVKSRMGRGE